MINLLNILIIILLFVLLPFVLGSFLNNLDFSGNKRSLAEYFPFGYAVMLAVFQLIAVPLVACHAPFSVLILLWSISILVLFAIALIKNRISIIRACKEIKLPKAEDKLQLGIWIITIAIVVFQTWLLAFNMHTDTDDSRFLAEAMEAFEQNTMLMIHPINGNYIGGPIGEMTKELSSPFPFFIAMVSKIAMLHPTVMAHVIFPVIFIPLCYITIYSIGRFFLEKDEKSIALFMLFFSLIMLFSFESIYALGYTLLTIIWQGRSILATIMLPFLWLLLMKEYNEEKNGKLLLALLTVSLACCALSGMGIMMSFCMTFAYAFAVFLVNKNKKKALLMCMTVVPSIIYFIYYFFSIIEIFG